MTSKIFHWGNFVVSNILRLSGSWEPINCGVLVILSNMGPHYYQHQHQIPLLPYRSLTFTYTFSVCPIVTVSMHIASDKKSIFIWQNFYWTWIKDSHCRNFHCYEFNWKRYVNYTGKENKLFKIYSLVYVCL